MPDTDCLPRRGDCHSYHPGHQVHAIHAKRVGQTPWGWRDAVVVEAVDRVLTVEYLQGGRAVLWHHVPLGHELPPGSPLRVHERYYVIGAPLGWLNVLVTEGIGAVPEPEEPMLWAPEATWGVADLSTGRAIPLDHLD